MSVYDDAVALHKKFQGKLGTSLRLPVDDKAALSLVYTPGVAEVCRVIAREPNASFDLTIRGRSVAVVSDGSAVLGLGNIGAAAAMPVMEGKALLFKKFGDVDSVPLCVDLHTADELVAFVKAIAPSYAGINLEDIAAPLCFEVEDRLQDIGIPVFHDDQHGTAIVVRAAVTNAAKLAGKNFTDLKVVISGAGAAGLAVAQLLLGLDRKNGTYEEVTGAVKVSDLILVDSKGIVSSDRSDLDASKKNMLAFSNKANTSGSLADAVTGADVFIGVSKGGLLKAEMVKTMAEKSIIFAMANPDPEILPDDAKAAGAFIIGTGRSDFANQVNNSLAFPGFFRGLLDAGATKISFGMKQAASEALVQASQPKQDAVLPTMFQSGVAELVAQAVKAQAIKEGYVRQSV